MKKIYPVLLLLSLTLQVKAQCSWEPVGNTDSSFISNHATSYTSLAVDDSNHFYIAFSDAYRGNRTCVKKYSNGSWQTLGVEGFSPGATIYNSLAVSTSGVPYIAFSDISQGYKATVMKFTGSSWVIVGNAGFSAGAAVNVSLAIDSIGTPYVAYSDATNGNKGTVNYFDGTSWLDLGGPGFTVGAALTPSLKISPAGVVCVGYRDQSVSNKATVSYFSGSSWSSLGGAGFTAGAVTQTVLDFDSSGNAYIAFFDSIHGNTPKVKKFNGTAWITLDSLTGSYWESLGFNVTSSSEPYIILSSSNSAYFSVFKFNGVSWNSEMSLYYGMPPGFKFPLLESDKLGNIYTSYTMGRPSVIMKTGSTVKDIGMPGAVSVAGSVTSMAVNDSGVAYVVVRSGVYKFNGTDWEQVGNSDSLDYAISSLAFDSLQTPYLAYRFTNPYTTFWVKKFDGVNWVPVGSGVADSTAYSSTQIYLTFGTNDTPYVACNYKVYKFNGNSWFKVGSSLNFKITSIGSTPQGNLLLAGFSYVSGSSFSKINLQTYALNGSSWILTSTSPTTYKDEIKTVIAPSGNVFASISSIFGSPLKLMKYDGVSWNFIGDSLHATISNNGVEWPQLALDSSETPYLCFSPRYGSSQNLYVYKFSGNSIFNTGSITNLSPKFEHKLVISKLTNRPLVAFGNTTSYVKKLECLIGASVDNISKESKIRIYPNPSSSMLTIECDERINEVHVMNLLGEVLQQKFVYNNETKLNMSSFAQGVYLVELICDTGRSVRKIVKE